MQQPPRPTFGIYSQPNAVPGATYPQQPIGYQPLANGLAPSSNPQPGYPNGQQQQQSRMPMSYGGIQPGHPPLPQQQQQPQNMQVNGHNMPNSMPMALKQPAFPSPGSQQYSGAPVSNPGSIPPVPQQYSPIPGQQQHMMPNPPYQMNPAISSQQSISPPPMPASRPNNNMTPNIQSPIPGAMSPTLRQGSMVGYSQAPSHPGMPNTGQNSSLARPGFNMGMSTGSMAAAPTQPAPTAKINPSAMPSVVAVQEADQARFGPDSDSFRSSLVTDYLPPLTTTDVPIIDDGNCSSKFMRLTTYHLPSSEDTALSSKLPVSLVIQPFARTHIMEEAVPLVDFGENGPIRCNRCRSYMNLFVRFLRGGRSYECNICTMVNEVPDNYYCQLDHTGRRIDSAQRPELICGTVDYVATKEYKTRPAAAAHILFAVDCSRSAIQNGSFRCALEAIRRVIETHRVAGAARSYGKMAIITYDKAIQVYDLRAAEPQILVMSDTQEPFVPLSDGLFFDPLIAYEQALALLEKLPVLFSETKIIDSCLGAASVFAVEALKKFGGRTVVFASSLPTFGIGLLRNRDGTTTTPADKVNPLFLPQGDFYNKIGKEAAMLGISFCLVSTPSSHIDMATVGALATLTSGKILHYPRFSSDYSGECLVEDLYRYLTKPFVYDSIIRVRPGSNLQTGEYFGNFSTINHTDYNFAALDCDQSFAVTFFYDGKLGESERVSFQCAILHTTNDGQRRIRILNLAAPVTSLLANVFRMADLDALVQFSIKRAISQISTAPLVTLIQHFHVRSAQALASYRKNCAQSMPQGQLVLPESLKLLPIYCLALSKSTAFSSASVLTDTRMAELYNLMSAPMSLVNTLLYPKLYPLHRILELPEGDEPSAVRLSSEYLEAHGVYLLTNGVKIILWVGNVADPEVTSQLFGVAQIQSLARMDALPALQNQFSIRVKTFIDSIKYASSNYLPLQIIRQGIDPAEVEFRSMLVEDPNPSISSLSYVDFLCRLHNQINHEMNSSSLAEKTALLSFLQ